MYRRYPEREELPSYPFPSLLDLDGFVITDHLICFCGVLYPLLEINIGYTGYRYGTSGGLRFIGWGDKEYRSNRMFCYSAEDVRKYVQEKSKSLQKYEGFRSRRYMQLADGSFGRKTQQNQVEAYFNSYELRKAELTNQAIDMLEDHSCPLFALSSQGSRTTSSAEIIYNAQLNKFNFQRIKPPYQAFQELQQYLANIAVPIKPLPIISNSDMIQAKGFDLKESFRKPPSKKK